MNVKSRVAISLITNIARGALNIGISVALARLFGAIDYGRLVFLLSTFQAIRLLADPGISSAFYTFLSRKQRSLNFILAFWLFQVVKYMLLLLVIVCLTPNHWLSYIWRGENNFLIAISLTLVIIQFDWWPSAASMLESQRNTYTSQSIYIIFLISQLILILILYAINELKIELYFIGSTFIWVISIITAFKYYNWSDNYFSQCISLKKSCGEYISYCMPILPIVFLSFLSDFTDRWMLQRWGGNNEQAYLGVCLQISASTLLITSSIIRVLWKELAEFLENNKNADACKLYTESKKYVFYYASLMAGIIGPLSSDILKVVLGVNYVAASSVLSVMVYASIYQALGQVESTLQLASCQTKANLHFNYIIAPFVYLLSFIIVAGKIEMFGLTFSGLALGAKGVAVKLLITQVIVVGSLGKTLCKKMSWKYEWGYQIRSILVSIVLGYGSAAVMHKSGFVGITLNSMSILLYLACNILIIFIKPSIVGLSNTSFRPHTALRSLTPNKYIEHHPKVNNVD